MSNFRNLLEQRVAAVAGAGLGALTLGPPVPGRTGFTAADNGLPFRVLIFEGLSWEICEAVYTHAGASLARGVIEQSSAVGERVPFTPAAVVRQVLSADVLADIEEGMGGTPDPAAVTLGAGGALVNGSTVVAPAYLGVRTSAQITAIHAAIAAGTASYPAGSTLITEAGEPWILKGTGTAARFSPDTSPAPEVIVQPIRTGNSVAVQADAGAIVPFSGPANFTVPAGLTGFSVVVQRADTGNLTLLAGAGVTFRHAGAVVSSLSVTLASQYIVVFPTATANEYHLSRYTGV